MRILLLLSSLTLALSNNCQPEVDGHDYDFRALTVMGDNDYIASSPDYDYYVNICGTVNERGCDAAACQYSGPDYISTLGRYSDEDSKIHWTSMENGVIMTMANGDPCQGATQPRTTHVQLTCAAVELGPLTVVDDSSAHSCEAEGYTFRMETCHACVGGCSSKAMLFLKVTIGGFLVYLVLGTVWNHKKNEMGWKESFPPNKQFWIDLPGYVRVGCLFSFEKLKELITKFRKKESDAIIAALDDEAVDERKGLLDDDDNDLDDDITV